LAACHASAATNDVAISLYDRWERLPSEQLMKMGEQYRNVTRQPESALVCFSIVANRYYQGHQTRGDIKHAIEAITHIVWLYLEDFYDYPKAVAYNMQAHELADKHQCYDYMPFILINDANIHGLQFGLEHTDEFDTEGLNMMKKAFHASLKQKSWFALNVSFMNLILHTAFYDKESLIENEMDIIKNTQIPDSTTHIKFSRCLIDAIRAWNSNHPDSAGVFFENLIDIAREHHNPRQKALSQIVANDFLAFYYEATLQDAKAIAALQDNERIATELDSKVHLIDAYVNQMKYYEHLKDTKMAEHYRLLHLETTISLLTEKKLGKANEAKFLYDLNQKNEQVREMAQREQMKSRVMWGALITALVLLTLLVLLWVNNRRINERNRQLYNKSLEMLRAEEEKRQLIEQLQGVQTEVPAQESTPYAPAEETHREGKLSEARQSDLLHRVFMVMETSEEIYSSDFTLPRLAELVGDTRNNVSEAINLRYRDNFNGLINEYRVKEACRRINDRTQWSDYTLEAIGQSVGFGSRSSFWAVFKDIVGLTPGAYQRQSKEEKT
jgi:AraC-like DNA-binding protein